MFTLSRHPNIPEVPMKTKMKNEAGELIVWKDEEMTG